MRPSNKEYSEMAKRQSPPSTKIKDFALAYLIGGAICVLGQLLRELYTALGFDDKVVRMAVPCCSGIVNAVKTALMNSGKFIPWSVTVLSIDGNIVEES